MSALLPLLAGVRPPVVAAVITAATSSRHGLKAVSTRTHTVLQRRGLHASVPGSNTSADEYHEISDAFLYHPQSSSAINNVLETCAKPADLTFVVRALNKYRVNGQPIKQGVANAVVDKYIELDQAHKLLKLLRDKENYGLFPTTNKYNDLCEHFIGCGRFAAAKRLFDQLVVDRAFPANTYSFDLVSRALMSLGTRRMAETLVVYVNAGLADGVEMNRTTLTLTAAAASLVECTQSKAPSSDASQTRSSADWASLATNAATNDSGDKPWLTVNAEAIAAADVLSYITENRASLSEAELSERLGTWNEDTLPPILRAWLPKVAALLPATAEAVSGAIKPFGLEIVVFSLEDGDEGDAEEGASSDATSE